MLGDRQLTLTAQGAIELGIASFVSDHILRVMTLLYIHVLVCRHRIANVLIHKLLLRRVHWTVIEGLAVYGAPLFKLLLHLIRYHLLAEAYLSKLDRTMIVVLSLFNNCTTLMTL